MHIRQEASSSARPWYVKDYTKQMRFVEREPAAGGCEALTPQEIMKKLKKYVIGQDEACRQIAIMMYQHFQGHRLVGLLAGPTGSGKSFLTETLKKLFPGIIYLQEVSNLTCDGWTGTKKVLSLFQDIAAESAMNGEVQPLLVLDECDKLFMPRITSHGENASESVQAELLAVIHGSKLKIGKEIVDTSRMSFLFAGAFDRRARIIAKEESGSLIGFGSTQKKVCAYNRKLTMEDIREAGCIAELCGRIGRVINLDKFEEKQFREMLDIRECGPVYELEKEFHIRFKISNRKKEELAHNAFRSGLGIRGIKNELRSCIDEAIWEDCRTQVIEL